MKTDVHPKTYTNIYNRLKLGTPNVHELVNKYAKIDLYNGILCSSIIQYNMQQCG